MNSNGAPPSPAPSPETWSSSATAPLNANPQVNTSGANNATLGSGSTSSSSGRSGGQFAGNQRSPNVAPRHHHFHSNSSSYRPRPSRTTHYYGPGSVASGTAIASPVPVMASGSAYGPTMSPAAPAYGANPYSRVHAPLDRRTGHVKFFNSTKGFGFIIPDVPLDDTQSELEVFVHHTAITSPNRSFRSLAEGEPVEFDLVQGPKGYYSQNVTGPQGTPVRGDPKVLTIPRKPLPNFYHPRQGYPHEFPTSTDASGVAILPSGEHPPSGTGLGDANDPSSLSGMMPHAMQPGMAPPHMAQIPPGAVMYFIPVPPMVPGAQPGDASQDAGGGGPTSPVPMASPSGQPPFMYQPYGYQPFQMQHQDASGAAGGPQSPTSPVPSGGSATSNPSAGMPPQPYMVPMPPGYPMPYAYMSPPPVPMSPTHHPTSPSGPGTSPMADTSFSAASSASSMPPGFIPAHGSTPTLGMYGSGNAPPNHLSMPIVPMTHVSNAAAAAADVQGMEAHMASLSFGGGAGTGGMPRTDSGHDFQSPMTKPVGGGGSTSVRRSSLSAADGAASAAEAANEAAVSLQDDYPGDQ